MKMYIKFKTPIYPFKVHVFLNYKTASDIKADIQPRKPAHRKKLLEHIDTLALDTVLGYSIEHGGNLLIFVKTFNGLPKCYDTLHHEIVHAIFSGAKYIGMEYNEGSEEFFSYMHGYITNQIYTVLDKELN